jgi:hypothetical protein
MYLAPDLAEAAGSDPVVGQLRSTHDFYRKGYDAIRTALRTQDPTRTPEAHFMEIKQKAERWINDCARKAEAANAAANSTVEALEKEITETLAIKDGTYAREVRAHFLGMNKNDRINAVRIAIEAFDKETMGALLSGPSYLSGFSDDEQAMFRRLYAEKHAAKQIARKAVIQKALRTNSNAFDEALIELGGMFPKKKADDISARIELAQAAKDNILAA